MRLVPKTLAAALIAVSIPLVAGNAIAAPIGQPLSLKSADMNSIEPVQYRRWNRGRWIGPAIGGFAAGVAIGSALAPRDYDDGYYAYGAAPGYVAPRYVVPGYSADGRVRANPQYGSCTGDRDSDSGYPSWACQ